MRSLILAAIIPFSFSIAWSKTAPDWSKGATVPADGRANIYNHNGSDFMRFFEAGQVHAQAYPVTVTGVLPPYQPIKRVIEEPNTNAFRKFFQRVLKRVSGVNSFSEVLKGLGLHPYNGPGATGIYDITPPPPQPESYMGFGILERNGAQGFTFSCATCHSSNLFGTTVLGLTNRFPRANEFFLQAKSVFAVADSDLFQRYTGATDAETALFRESKQALRYVGAKQPIALGLDTSLAQVAISLSKRSRDEYASYSSFYLHFPRHEVLTHTPADSKPAVWWNVKYKNRWLSDGSVVSSNPIFTNLIWNEVGRGADLKKLEEWMYSNPQIIEELTTAVFATEAPHITDFFPPEVIDLQRAQRGEKIYLQTCARCHGVYEKAWNLPEALHLSPSEQLKTTQVKYHANTPVVDVGTDPHRYKGMQSLVQLNELSISKANDIVIETQKGYVPPPLVGIWARWPYFHNNSAPSLCAVLTPSAQRPRGYYAGEALNRETDFDLECNGYPLGDKTPKSWKKRAYFYDTRQKGMGNRGHDVGIFIKDGQEILSTQDKRDLIQFLQTL